MMISSLQLILQHNCHIGINKPVVIGVSGGPDSLCLLDLLHRLGYLLIVAHLNHGLREVADTEARLVEREASSRKLPFVTAAVDIRAFADENKLSVEEAARRARYEFLFDQARQYQAQAVAVGHNADDQVETVLMHLLRGAGLAGLAGMDYSVVLNEFDDLIPLVRPLLGFWRAEINAYIAERGLVPAVDESNWDITFSRNRLRHELIPFLESYNPQVRRTIYRMADVLRGEGEVVERAVESALETSLLLLDSEYIIFSASRLNSQPVGIQRRLIRHGIDLLRPGLRDIDYRVVERGRAALSRYHQSDIELVDGLFAKCEDDHFILASRMADLPAGSWPQIPPGGELCLDIPGECLLSNGWRLRSQAVTVGDQTIQTARNNTNPYQVWINAEQITPPITVRGRIPGDRFYPLGMDDHSIKISDFMINVKIPSRLRDGWPLIVCAGDIIWVPGYRQANHTRLLADSRRALYLELIRDS